MVSVVAGGPGTERLARLAGLLCVALAFVAGCAGDDGAPAPALAPSTFERIQAEVFDVSCSLESCHSSAARAGDLMLEPDHSWQALVNRNPANAAASRYGLMRVMPGEPARSFLMAKLAGNLAAGEGVPMPYGGPPLDQDTMAIIEAWIEAGAPAEGRVPGDDGRPLGGSGNVPGEPIHLPPPGHGVQLNVVARPLPRGEEETLCHYLKLPSPVALDFNRVQIAVNGGSHHIHLYRPYAPDVDIADGFEECNRAVDFDDWALVVATQTRRSDWELPPGVAFHLRAHEQLLVQTHFVNIGSLDTTGAGTVAINLHAADPGAVTHHAAGLFGQDRDVFVPARSNPTAAAECVFPNPVTLLAQTGHYHFRGRRFSTYRWDNGRRGAEIYRYEGYEEPPFLIYPPAIAPRFAAGQGLQWECYWENPTNADFEFGPFTDTNEHCNLFAFYYPAQSPTESTTCVKEHGVSTTTVRR